MRRTARCAVSGLLAAMATLASTGSASAGPIAEGTYLELSFADVGVPATGCDPADPAGAFCTASSGTSTLFLDAPPWTFTAPALGAELTVVDAFLSGDRFEVFDAGVSIGTTSLPAAGSDCGDDPADCLLDASISHGVFLLGAGDHAITIAPVASEGGGAAYLRWNAVPEPGPVGLVAAASTLLAIARRRGVRR